MSARRWSERAVGATVFPVWAWKEHRGYASFRRELERTQYWERARLEELQQQRLRDLVRHADAHCPFYRERFRRAGVECGAGADVRGWERVPALTKRDIQDHRKELAAADYPAKARIGNQTGGSTGSPLQFLVDRRRMATRMASTHRHNRWAGMRPGDWVAQLWGARLDEVPTAGWWAWCRQHALHRLLFFNTARISAADWESYLATLRQHRPRFLLAYARSAAALAEYVLAQGITDIRFEAIIATAEVLLPEHRQQIEAAFGGKVFNRYGCREVSVIASECGEHDGLHVNAEALLVEIVPAEGVPAPWGKVLITDLLNRSMPLIRYEVGDVARWAEGECRCGRRLPRLAAVEGRTTDFLELPDGGSVSGPVLTLVFADMPNVRQVQFVQRGRGEVRLRVIPGPGFDEAARQQMRARLRPYLRDAVALRIEEVSRLASEASGKYRFVVHESAEEGRG